VKVTAVEMMVKHKRTIYTASSLSFCRPMSDCLIKGKLPLCINALLAWFLLYSYVEEKIILHVSTHLHI